MAQVPLNQRLWDSLVAMAKTKFHTWPSLPASRWVHEQYEQKGGRFASGEAVARAKKHAHAVQKSRAAQKKDKK